MKFQPKRDPRYVMLQRDAERKAICLDANCGWEGPAGATDCRIAVEFLAEAVGEEVPCGTCPNCGEPCYYNESNVAVQNMIRMAKIDWNTLPNLARSIKSAHDRFMRLCDVKAPPLLLWNELKLLRKRAKAFQDRLLAENADIADSIDKLPDETDDASVRAADTIGETEGEA